MKLFSSCRWYYYVEKGLNKTISLNLIIQIINNQCYVCMTDILDEYRFMNFILSINYDGTKTLVGNDDRFDWL